MTVAQEAHSCISTLEVAKSEQVNLVRRTAEHHIPVNQIEIEIYN